VNISTLTLVFSPQDLFQSGPLRYPRPKRRRYSTPNALADAEPREHNTTDECRTHNRTRNMTRIAESAEGR